MRCWMGRPYGSARFFQVEGMREAFSEHGPLVFGDRSLDLEQELIIGVVRDRVLQEHHLTAQARELLEAEHLMSVLAGLAVGTEDRYHVEG
jgi:hypothetical protein